MARQLYQERTLTLRHQAMEEGEGEENPCGRGPTLLFKEILPGTTNPLPQLQHGS